MFTAFLCNPSNVEGLVTLDISISNYFSEVSHFPLVFKLLAASVPTQPYSQALTSTLIPVLTQ